jgi:hypothetical protein
VAKEYLETKVTTINSRHHCRLLRGETVLNEMACELKEDIGFCIRYMMRMHDKCGGTSLQADASRHRRDSEGGWKNTTAKGKIWYPSQIPIN